VGVGRRIAVFAALLSPLPGLGGCAGIPIAAAGTVAGLAATTVDTGSALYKMGKLDTADLATFDEVISATRTAGDEMGLAMRGFTTMPPDFYRLVYADDQGAQMTVTIRRRTAKLTYTRIDVGLFGSEPTARLFLARIRGHFNAGPQPGRDDPRQQGGPQGDPSKRTIRSTDSSTPILSVSRMSVASPGSS
jgi:hypothetical protein